jgi:hypothetical protein
MQGTGNIPQFVQKNFFCKFAFIYLMPPYLLWIRADFCNKRPEWHNSC